MPVTFKFHKISELKPHHGDEIIWLKGVTSFHSQGFDPVQTVARYMWAEVDDSNDFTGTFIEYDPDEPTIDYEALLMLQFDGVFVGPDDLWMSVDDYWDSFED